MKTTTRFLLSASAVLAMALTFSACSDDDKGSSYGTCKEAEASYTKCTNQLTTAYTDCVAAALSDPAAMMACLDLTPTEESLGKCVTDSGVCGSASIEECEAHFEKECSED